MKYAMKIKSSRSNEAYLNKEKMEIEFFFFQAKKKKRAHLHQSEFLSINVTIFSRFSCSLFFLNGKGKKGHKDQE